MKPDEHRQVTSATPLRTPPRIFAIMAAEAPVAAVLRRGPSAWVQLLAWDTAKDTFTDGAWLRGRLYGERCDVSPDGALFLYHAHQGRKLGTSTTDTWTAVSRLPWLHALRLWPWGTTYGGGGRFEGPRRLRLRTWAAPPTHPDQRLDDLEVLTGDPPLHRSTGEVPGATWSGRDQRGRLVFAHEGRLYCRRQDHDVLLVDLVDRHPDPRPAPAWAHGWPEATSPKRPP
jgi:hypothetical protein